MIRLGRALQDPAKGMTALTRAGVDMQSENIKLAKRLSATGDVLGAQRAILRELRWEFGGSAEDYGKTLPAQLTILRESFKNLGADLLTATLPAMLRVVHG